MSMVLLNAEIGIIWKRRWSKYDWVASAVSHFLKFYHIIKNDIDYWVGVFAWVIIACCLPFKVLNTWLEKFGDFLCELAFWGCLICLVWVMDPVMHGPCYACALRKWDCFLNLCRPWDWGPEDKIKIYIINNYSWEITWKPYKLLKIPLNIALVVFWCPPLVREARWSIHLNQQENSPWYWWVFASEMAHATWLAW